MTYLIVGLLLLAAMAFVAYDRIKRMAARKTLASASNFVRVGLFLRLQRVYLNALDPSEAVLLARCVVGLIFCEQQMEPEAVNYQAENLSLIEKEARRLASDRALCKLITRAALADAAGTRRGEAERLERLKQLDLYEIYPKEPDPRGYFCAARAFYDVYAEAAA